MLGICYPSLTFASDVSCWSIHASADVHAKYVLGWEMSTVCVDYTFSGFCTPVFVYHMPPGQRCARRDTTVQMELLRPRLGAQLARLARCQEWSANLAAGNANRAIFACPGRLELRLNLNSRCVAGWAGWAVHG